MFKNEEMYFILAAILFIAIIFFYNKQQNCEKYSEEYDVNKFVRFDGYNGLNGDITILYRNTDETTPSFIARCGKIALETPDARGFILDYDMKQLVPSYCWIKKCDGCVGQKTDDSKISPRENSIFKSEGYTAYLKKTVGNSKIK